MSEKERSSSSPFLVTATEDAPVGRLSKASSQAPATSAGREMDAEVMAAVFKREIEWWRGEPSYVGTDTSLGDAPGAWVTRSTVPRFSTSLVDAMKVLDAWKGGWRSQRFPADRAFTVTLYASQKDSMGTSATHESFTVAVCLAALKAVGA